jgi:AAA family ATP:ADP antiporter
MPVVGMIVGFQGIRRAAHYGLERPAREVLFTVVSPEEKYTSKSFIDTVVYRGGDAASVWAYQGLLSIIGSAVLSLSMLPLTGVWLLLNGYMARQQAARAREAAASAAPPRSSQQERTNEP